MADNNISPTSETNTLNDKVNTKKELQSIYLSSNEPMDFAREVILPKLGNNVTEFKYYIEGLDGKDIGFFVFNDLSYGLTTMMQSIYVAPQSSTLGKPIFAIHPSIQVQYKYLKDKLNKQLNGLSESETSITQDKAQSFINLAIQSQISTQSAYRELKKEITRIVNKLGHTRNKLNDNQEIISPGYLEDNVEINSQFNRFVENLRSLYTYHELDENNKKINKALTQFNASSERIEPNTENFFLDISYLLLQCSFFLGINNQVGVVATIHKLNERSDDVKKHGLYLNDVPISKRTEYSEQREELYNAYELLSTFLKEKSFGQKEYSEIEAIQSSLDAFSESDYSLLLAKKKAYDEWTEKEKELEYTPDDKIKYEELEKIDEELKKKEEKLQDLLDKKNKFDQEKLDFNRLKNNKNAEIQQLREQLEKEKLEFIKVSNEKKQEINNAQNELEKELSEKKLVLEKQKKEIQELQKSIDESTKVIENLENRKKNIQSKNQNLKINNSSIKNLEKKIENLETNTTSLTEPTFDESDKLSIEQLERNIESNKEKLAEFDDLKAKKKTFNNFHSSKVNNWTNQNSSLLENMQKKKTLINSGVKLNRDTKYSIENLRGFENTFKRSESDF